MSLISKIKKAAIGLGLLGALAAPAAAQESASQSPGPQSVETKVNEPTRTLYPLIISNNEPGDPRNGFEANTHAWYTTNQLIGRGSDFLGEDIGLDKYPLARPAFLLFHHYLITFSDYLSHEVAHNYVSRKKFGDVLAFEFGSARGLNNPGIFYRNTGNMAEAVDRDPDLFLQSIAAGMNQQEHNAQFIHEQTIKNGRIHFDEGWGFLTNKLQNFHYIRYENGKAASSIEELRRGSRRSVADPVGYRTGLKEKGIGLSTDALLAQNAISTLFSVHTYNSFFAAFGMYLGKGKRSIEPWWMDDLVDGCKDWKVRITPPLITHYLTPDGGFWDVTVFIKTKEKKPSLFEVHLGTDVDYIGDGKLNTVRFGGKWHDVRLLPGLENTPTISPSAYINLKRNSGEWRGLSVGIEVAIPLYNSGIAITGRIEGNANDVIENKVKLEDNGFNASLGLKIKLSRTTRQ